MSRGNARRLDGSIDRPCGPVKSGLELAAQDAKHVLADKHKIIESGVRLFPRSWLFNDKGGGSSTSAAATGLPCPPLSSSSAWIGSFPTGARQ
jgi:hypothetical protein